jgi:hypothetical protein
MLTSGHLSFFLLKNEKVTIHFKKQILHKPWHIYRLHAGV